jgi:formylmethanofuran dehydrogenase subunit E
MMNTESLNSCNDDDRVRSICSYTFEKYVERVQDFHGFPAPGVIIGGFMVDLAYRYLPADGLFDAISETPKCLPDAIQLLTPCTIGNGWLSIINIGRFALTLYDKTTGQGIRVFIDAEKLELWPTIKQWYFKLVPKKHEDAEVLINTIRKAGVAILGVRPVIVPQIVMDKKRRGTFVVCPRCEEGYPAAAGLICRACQGELIYVESGDERKVTLNQR